MKLTDEMFEERGTFGSRGITREVAEVAFFPYELGGSIPPSQLWVGDPDEPYGDERRALTEKDRAKAIKRSNTRAARAPGMMMRRFPVPGADPFLFAEQRPDREVWTGRPPRTGAHRRMTHGSRKMHQSRDRTTAETVRKGCTDDELASFERRAGWTVNQGADHAGHETDERHFHVKLAKYLFPKNSQKVEAYEHDHLNTTPHRRRRHLWQDHSWPEVRYSLSDSGRVPSDPVSRAVFDWAQAANVRGRHVDQSGRTPDDELHPHERKVDETFYARRLSSHPTGFARIADAEYVCFALEGCLKEAALVTAGHATFSCPSVTLWRAPELEEFVMGHLAGRTVLVIPDSDAWQNDQVVAQALLATETLRMFGARAEVAIPTSEPEWCERHHKPRGGKRGVDDYLADGESIEEMVWMRREPGRDLAGWLADRGVRSASGRKPRHERVEMDNVILRWLSIHANENGESRTALTVVARYVQRELELLKGARFTNPRSVVTDVSRAVHRMDEYGALTGADTLPDRQMWMEADEWPGALRVHEDLRSVTHKSRVVDLLGERVD
ncbi:MAG: hypothetical protein ACRDMH_12655 [Solirubrobacterales bacterium]